MFQPTDSQSIPGLYGRNEELDTLRRFVSRLDAPRVRGGALLITGPAGIGKTRIMREGRRLVRKRGINVLEASCRPDDDRPNGVFIDLIAKSMAILNDAGQSSDMLEAPLERLMGVQTSESPDREIDADELLQVCEMVRAALLNITARTTPAIFIRDLHWADSTTIRLLRYLIENLLTDPAFDWTPPDMDGSSEQLAAYGGLVFVSFRKTENTQPLVDAAGVSESIEHLEVGGLSLDGVRAYLQTPGVVERFASASAGNPLLMERIVHALPSGPDALSQLAFDGLDDTHHTVLDILAVLQRPCTVSQIKAIGQMATSLKAPLDTLVTRNILVRDLSDARPHYRFKRVNDGRNWLASMDETMRTKYHLSIAERLAAGFETEPEVVARHFIAAGARADAVPYAIAAAKRLQEALAHERAVALLEEIVETTEDELHLEVLDQMSTLYTATGNIPSAFESLKRLSQLDPTRRPVLRARYAQLLTTAGEYEKAREAALSTLPDTNDERVALRLLSIAADAAYRLGDLTAAEGMCDTTDYTNVQSSSPELLSLRNTLGKVFLFREKFDDAEALFTLNLAHAQRSANSSHQAKALINLGVVYLQRSAPDDALEKFEEARRLCEATGDLSNLAISLENLAVLYHRRQVFAKALTFYHQSTVTSRRLGLKTQLATSAMNLADLYLTVGDGVRAQRLADIASDYIRRYQLRFLEPQSIMLLGDLARSAGDVSRAAERYAAAISHIERGDHSNQRIGSLLWAQAELCLEQGVAEAAQAYVDQVMALSSGLSETLAVRLRMTQGGIFSALNKFDDAVSELEAAVHAAVVRDDREALWQARARLALSYWQRGDLDDARTALTRALEVIERVAAELPPSMRTLYREKPRRRAVRDALRRVRSGLDPSPQALERASGPMPVFRRALETYQPHWAEKYPGIIGRSPTLFPVFNALDRVSHSDSMVLIRGESGTGKELVAAALHANSPRASSPFVKVNCAAFVETLLLSELFGHEKGAFTGAVSSKKGRFELAHGGTLFLDEIGDISPNTQVALLRVLQEKAFERVGGSDTLSVDVRVVCATHRNLEAMVQDGSFRADLYYRLRGVSLELPALRERSSDIPLLVRHFLKKRATSGRAVLKFDRIALASLVQHEWPGNVRELENVVHSVALFADGDTIGLSELAELGDILAPPSEASVMALSEMLETSTPASLPPVPETAPSMAENEPSVRRDLIAPVGRSEGEGGFTVTDSVSGEQKSGSWIQEMIDGAGSLAELKKQIEFEAIANALKIEKGNITRAAKRLGMKRPRLSQIIHGNPILGELKRDLAESE